MDYEEVDRVANLPQKRRDPDQLLNVIRIAADTIADGNPGGALCILRLAQYGNWVPKLPHAPRSDFRLAAVARAKQSERYLRAAVQNLEGAGHEASLIVAALAKLAAEGLAERLFVGAKPPAVSLETLDTKGNA